MTREEIIKNFLEGKLDAGDVAIIDTWLKENPAELAAWEKEWHGFQPDHVLASEVSAKLWKGIKRNNTSHRPYSSGGSRRPFFSGGSRHHYFRWMAVAASVILVIGLPWHFILKKQKTNLISAAAVPTTKNIFNNTPQKMTFKLSDGSQVELLPNSTLSFAGDFNALKRAVILKGGANFDIARDVARPFTVYSHSVLTTVLGTRFTVRSFEADNTTVILHEGRVMVKVPDSASHDNKKEYYLTPGDVFILNKVNVPARTKNAERFAIQGNVAQDPLPADSVCARVIHIEKDKDDHYVFDNYPLDVVFDQLQIIYNTTIIYDKSRLGTRSFIGEIDKKDSLYHILKSIALLNNFSLRRQGDSIIISN